MTAPSNIQIIQFEVSQAEQLIVVLTEFMLQVLEPSVDEGGRRTLECRAVIVTPYTHDQIDELDWVQQLDTMIFVHPDHSPRQLQRQGTAQSWRLRPIIFESRFIDDQDVLHIPQEAVNDENADNPGNAEIWQVELFGFATNDDFEIIIEGAGTGPVNRENTGAGTRDNLSVALNAMEVFTGSFEVTNDGEDRFTIEYSIQDLSIEPRLFDVETATYDTTGAIAVWRTQKGKAYKNNKWSNDAGWPRSVSLYQERLWFGGSRSFPDTIWGSRIGDLFSFANQDNDDDEAIEGTISASSLPRIRAIHPGRNLSVFTDVGEFYAPQQQGQPLTPDNFTMRNATNRGILTTSKPIGVTGVTMYLEPNGAALREFVFVDTEQDYTSQNVSLLASHLLRSPFRMRRWPARTGQEADLILVTNDDGQGVSVFATLRDQEVAGWFGWSGDWLDFAVQFDRLYGVRKITVGDDEWNVLCRFSDATYVDLSPSDPEHDQQIADPAALANLHHLRGQTVQLAIDGKDFGDFDLVAGTDGWNATDAELTIEQAVESGYQIGLGIRPWMRQLDTAIQHGGGIEWMDRKKRIMAAAIEVQDTLGILVSRRAARDEFPEQGELLAWPRYYTPTTEALDPITGRVVSHGGLGWDDAAALTIGQNRPYPFEVVAIHTKVAL